MWKYKKIWTCLRFQIFTHWNKMWQYGITRLILKTWCKPFDNFLKSTMDIKYWETMDIKYWEKSIKLSFPNICRYMRPGGVTLWHLKLWKIDPTEFLSYLWHQIVKIWEYDNYKWWQLTRHSNPVISSLLEARSLLANII